jgi:hypothetical protein
MRRAALLMAGVAFLGAANPAEARGTASKCLLTLKRVELKNAAGNWIVVSQPNVDIDLNAQDAGHEFVNLGTIPEGEYFNVRTVFSETIRFAGSDGKHMTKAGGKCVVGSPAKLMGEQAELTKFEEASPTWNDWREDLMTQTFDFDNGDRDDEMDMTFRMSLGRPFRIKSGTKVGLFIYIPLTKCVEHLYPDALGAGVPKGHAMVFHFPPAVARYEVIVDREVFTMRESAVRFEY